MGAVLSDDEAGNNQHFLGSTASSIGRRLAPPEDKDEEESWEEQGRRVFRTLVVRRLSKEHAGRSLNGRAPAF